VPGSLGSSALPESSVISQILYGSCTWERALQLLVKCEYVGSSLPLCNRRINSAAHLGVMRELSPPKHDETEGLLASVKEPEADTLH
jgi:hypothetical protein